jgi:hypothetical protein
VNFDDPEDDYQPEDFSDRYGIVVHSSIRYRNWRHKSELRHVFWDDDDEINFDFSGMLVAAMKAFLREEIHQYLKILPKYTVSVDGGFFESDQAGDAYDDEEAVGEDGDLNNTPNDVMETRLYLHFDGAYLDDVVRLYGSARFEVDVIYALGTFFKNYLRSQGLAEDFLLIEHEVDSFSG